MRNISSRQSVWQEPVHTYGEINAKEFKHAPAVLGALTKATHLTCSRSSPPASTRFYPRWGRHGSTLFAVWLGALDPHVSGHMASHRVIDKVVHLRAFVSCCPENFPARTQQPAGCHRPVGANLHVVLPRMVLSRPSASFGGGLIDEAASRRSSPKHATCYVPATCYAHHIPA